MSSLLRNNTLEIKPATADLWDDLERLFGDRGACGGCWCMFWRLSRSEFNSGKGAGNRDRLRQMVEKGPPPGLLGYVGENAVAWCAVAPREQYGFLSRSHILRSVDHRPVWSISCLYVDRTNRRRGLSSRMLAGAVQYAAEKGACIVEGYPVDPGKERAPDAFVWTGLASAFENVGFGQVARRSATRPAMRYVIRHSD